MKALDKIKSIVNREIDRLDTLSQQLGLTSDQINDLRQLASTALAVEEKQPTKKRKRIRGDHLSDEELLERAKV
jgi:hypothetical protein